MGNSLGRAPLGRCDTEATIGWTEGKPWEIAWGGESPCGKERYGSDDTGFQDKFHQYDCSENCAPKTCQSF